MIFFVILSGLVLFFSGFDYMNAADKMPDSANLKLLYLIYRSFYISDLVFPVVIVMSFIVTIIQLIKSNALIAYASLGFSKKQVLKPLILISTILLLIYSGLHATKYAYGKEFSDNIIRKNQYLNSTMNLFFKYETEDVAHQKYYIYLKHLYPLQKKADGIRLFKMSQGVLTEILKANTAYYKDGKWNIYNSTILKKDSLIDINSQGIHFSNKELVVTLNGFKPKILDQVSEGEASFTLLDALEAYFILYHQDISLDKIKSIIYNVLVFPFFALPVIIIFFIMIPNTPRYANLAIYGFGGLFATLILWGLLFALGRLSINGTLSPEVGIVVPIIVLFFISSTLYFKKI